MARTGRKARGSKARKPKSRATSKKPAPPKQAASKSRAPRRPRQAAPRKRDYKAEYRARVKGTKPGTLERQKQRGHAPPPGKTESQVRREHEAKRDRDRSRRLTKFAKKQAWRGEGYGARDWEEIRAGLKAHIAELGPRDGWRWFDQLDGRIGDLNEEYIDSSHRSLGLDMIAESEQWQLPASELFYH
jgi:hypothetical protein